MKTPRDAKITTEQPIKVAIQGITGAFHHEAAEQLLPGAELAVVECNWFPDVFKAVADDAADYGVVAIENSLNGSINEVYRLLEKWKLWVCGEVYLRIEQFLIGYKKQELAALDAPTTIVMSHPVALAQCERWLDTHLPSAIREVTTDTAESVRFVVQQKSATHLAIAGQRAAKLYNGQVLAGAINDDKHNYTRFILLSKKRQQPPGANKTSIVLKLGNRPGDLYRVLGAFDAAGINLSKLDSHPIPSDHWHYAFYLDFEVGLNEDYSHPVLAELKEQGCNINVLGTYKSSALPD